MKTVIFVGIAIQFLLWAGCQNPPVVQPVPESQVNTELIQGYNDMALENAIIRQHTIYSYHFVSESRDLNDLGVKDLGILAKHYESNPGPLSIQRGVASAELYNARMDTVRQALQDLGIDPQTVQITDRSSGGDGMPSRQVLKVLEKSEETETSDKTGSTSYNTGNSSSYDGSQSGVK